jgi:hypothetical protein
MWNCCTKVVLSLTQAKAMESLFRSSTPGESTKVIRTLSNKMRLIKDMAIKLNFMQSCSLVTKPGISLFNIQKDYMSWDSSVNKIIGYELHNQTASTVDGWI